jgi:hypothetical protein
MDKLVFVRGHPRTELGPVHLVREAISGQHWEAQRPAGKLTIARCTLRLAVRQDMESPGQSGASRFFR